jgi:DNA-binding MarR family transcriptional regulator
MSLPVLDRVTWGIDLIRLEIMLWDRVDARLRERHDVSAAFFEVLLFVSRASAGGLRVGDLAAAMEITVGGASKLVDRVAAAGLIRRTPDPDDRRASRLSLTTSGRRKLTAAARTYDREVAALLDPVLDPGEQQRMHAYIARLLGAAREGATP